MDKMYIIKIKSQRKIKTSQRESNQQVYTRYT